MTTDGGFSRAVERDGFQATLMSYVHDSERRRPVWIDFVGQRNTVKAFLSRAKNKSNQGSSDQDWAFSVEHETGTTAFKLPDEDYKTFMRDLATPPEISWLNKKRRPTLHEGRIVSFNALGTAPSDAECYVPCWREILIPNTPDVYGLEPDQQWHKYLDYTEAPNAAKFKDYKAPVWAIDLFNVYMFLSSRVRIPMSPYWMPWMFKEVAGRNYWHGGQSIQLIKYIHGYTNPILTNLEKEIEQPVIEHGCYRVICNDAKESWRNLVASNPKRFDGIKFEKTANFIEPGQGDKPARKGGNIDDLSGDWNDASETDDE